MQKSLIAVAILSGLTSMSVDAGKVSIDTVLDASWVQQKYTFATSDDVSINTIEVKPTVAMQYDAARANVRGTLSHVQQRTSFDNDNDSVNNNFTEYTLTSQLTILKRLLTANGSISQNYTSFNPNQFLIDDFLLQEDELNKVQRSSFGLNSTIIQGDYFGGQASVSTNRFKTFDKINQINRETSGDTLALGIFSGRDFNWLSWSVDYTKRNSEQFNNGDFSSQYLQANASFKLLDDFGLSLTAQDETNTLSTASSAQNDAREFSSYGVGINYSPTNNRSIAVYYNKPSSASNDTDNFVSGSVNWDFSSRTAIDATISKRYYGRSLNANFRFNNRAFRMVIGRSESVTSSAQLLLDGTINANFVCGTGTIDIGDCFLPDTLDYELGVGESLISFSQPNFSLDDNLTLRKQHFINLSYQQRKLTYSLNASENEDSNELSEARFATRSIVGGINYQIGVFTSLNWDHSKSETKSFVAELLEGTGNIRRHDISVERQFGRDVSLTLTLSDIEREGFVPGFTNIRNEDFSDNRITLSVRYQPNSI